MRWRNNSKSKKQRITVAALATLSRRYTVNNCTVPDVDKGKLIQYPCPWDETRTIMGTKESAVWDANKWYKEQRKAAKAKQKDSKYKYKGKKRPWYMLDTRKTYQYEERKESWGVRTDFFKVPSEASVLYNKTVFKPRGKAWFMEQVVQQKLAKWDKKNPRPIKENSNDLFEEEFLVPWKAKREAAIEHIRDVVVSMYDKLPLVGRFEKSESSYSEELVAEIKDKTNEGHDINNLDTKKSKLLKNAQKKTNEVKIKRPNLVATNLRDHMRQKGRIILPKVA